jgi:hypothetical protein
MASEAVAPAQAAAAPNEDEYQTFSAALSASARGRAFLAEYARRHRGADTEILLAAIARLEALIRVQNAGGEPARAELRALIAAIRGARPEIAARSLPARAAKLAQLVDMLEQRLETLADAPPAPPGAGDTRLAVVPLSDEPELPIPSPAAAQPALIVAHERAPPAPVQEAASTDVLVVPEVTWLEPPPPAQELPAQEPAAQEEAVPVVVADVTPPAPRANPLEALMLLTEHERLALFT